MAKKKSNKNWWLISSFLGMFVLFVFISMRLMSIQYSDTENITITHAPTFKILEAPRGNILSEDGRILSVTMPIYDVRLDLVTVDEEVFNKNIKELSQKLSDLFNSVKSAAYYEELLRIKKKEGHRYFLLKKKVSYIQLQEMKKFPIFNLGLYGGGFMSEMKSTRDYPFGTLAKRTIGWVKIENDSIIPENGIELAFNKYLQGIPGKEMNQKISGGYYIPKKSEENILPIPGKDVITTINIEFQDAAETSLRNKLMETKALWGTVVLMEVETGNIKAIANLHRSKDSSSYFDSKNHAIVSEIIPGSTFKLASFISVLEDGYIKLTDSIETGNGFTYFDKFKISDTKIGGYGTISFGDAFVVSSNVAISKVIHKHYKSNPEKFYSNLQKFHLTEPLDLQLPFRSSMVVRKPTDKKWSGTTLPSMSYGYEMEISPLQILTFYNAVANNGVMVSPKFVSTIKDETGVIETFPRKILSERICSEKTIKSIIPYMVQVVSNQRENWTTDKINGTSANIYTDKYTIAGKTGTVKNEFWKWSEKTKFYRTYTASFAGFFPAENPKYSCIVVIHNFVDTTNHNHYGGQVAAPVFKEISDKVFAFDSEMEYLSNSDLNSDLNTDRVSDDKLQKEESLSVIERTKLIDQLKKGIFPDLHGMEIMDVLFVLENNNIKVEFEGVGRVTFQSVKNGSLFEKGLIVKLKLS